MNGRQFFETKEGGKEREAVRESEGVCESDGVRELGRVWGVCMHGCVWGDEI